MNRREFGKAAIGVAGAALVSPAALASAPFTIQDCIAIDYKMKARSWHHLEQPDDKGRTFIYEETEKLVSFRHFELLRDDGLVMGQSSRLSRWSKSFHEFENDFLHASMPRGAKPFTHDEFLTYAQQISDSLQGHIVPVEELPGMENVRAE